MCKSKARKGICLVEGQDSEAKKLKDDPTLSDRIESVKSPPAPFFQRGEASFPRPPLFKAGSRNCPSGRASAVGMRLDEGVPRNQGLGANDTRHGAQVVINEFGDDLRIGREQVPGENDFGKYIHATVD